MKRRCLCLLVLLLILTGCRPAEPKQLQGQAQENHSDYAGISVQMEELRTVDGKTELAILWSNTTEYDAIFGSSFVIERYADGEWVDCALVGELFFDALGYLLEAGQQRREIYDLTGLFDVSQTGTYRFRSSCSVDTGAQNSDMVELWVEFILQEEQVPAIPADTAQSTQAAAQLQEPPEGVLITPDGEGKLQTGGYSWNYETGGVMTAVIADQGQRPLSLQSLQTVSTSADHAETVHVLENGVYKPTSSVGCPVKLSWEAVPSSVSVTCWKETVFVNSNTPEESVPVTEAGNFYAKPGGYVYEIVATWEDSGAGYHGSVNYYVHIHAGHTHKVADQPQTVEDPITGFCGNTQTTLYIGGKTYSYMFDDSVALTALLINLAYTPEKDCACPCEFVVDTEFLKGYEVNLAQGFVRCEKGQADLTQVQIDVIHQIIRRIQTGRNEVKTDPVLYGGK